MSTDTREPSERQKMKSMTGLAVQRRIVSAAVIFNQVGAAGRRRRSLLLVVKNFSHMKSELSPLDNWLV